MGKITIIILAFLCLLISNSALALRPEQARHLVSIVPKPNAATISLGQCLLPLEVEIQLSGEQAEIKPIAEILQTALWQYVGMKGILGDKISGNHPSIHLKINENSQARGDEGYLLKVSEDGVFLEAKASAGLFYGTQSLIQLIAAKPKINGVLSLNCCQMNDYPRYPWRGMHLDVSRHFFPKEFIFKYLDAMALHKLNVFHWHLTDDQGWRVEIKKYPKLTELGAWREDQEDQGWNYYQYPCNDPAKKLYGGFYTQDDVREIVTYAAQRNILIVPEIDVPGHCTAAIYAYPELSCSKKTWTKNPNVPMELVEKLLNGQ